MTRLRMIALSLAVVGVLAAGAAGSKVYAQTAVTTGQGASSASDDASKWTRKHWMEMKAKWSLEKEKWAECRAKSKGEHLRGRKYWSFMAHCMTS